MKLYFAYGANLNMSAMAQRCPDAEPVSAFYLPGYRLAFSGVATIVPDSSATIPGALWHISDRDEENLDIFEGYPELYRKQHFNIRRQQFMAYVINADTEWPPNPTYVNTIRQGYRDWKLDQRQLDHAVRHTSYGGLHSERGNLTAIY
jgi:gamma-glutamylcyclotransferase (GGCT)/AIG2-like uncharacterized protein YtfP